MNNSVGCFLGLWNLGKVFHFVIGLVTHFTIKIILALFVKVWSTLILIGVIDLRIFILNVFKLAIVTRCLAAHVPIPFIDLAALEPQTLMELLNFLLWPPRIFLELIKEYFVLSSVLSETLLRLFCSLNSVTNDDSGNCLLSGLHFSTISVSTRNLWSIG